MGFDRQLWWEYFPDVPLTDPGWFEGSDPELLREALRITATNDKAAPAMSLLFCLVVARMRMRSELLQSVPCRRYKLRANVELYFDDVPVVTVTPTYRPCLRR